MFCVDPVDRHVANLSQGKSVAGASSKRRAAVETGWGKAVKKEVPYKKKKNEEADPSEEELKGYQLHINSHWYGMHHKQINRLNRLLD